MAACAWKSIKHHRSGLCGSGLAPQETKARDLKVQVVSGLQSEFNESSQSNVISFYQNEKAKRGLG